MISLKMKMTYFCREGKGNTRVNTHRTTTPQYLRFLFHCCNPSIPKILQEFGPDFSGVEGGELEMGAMEENKVENQQDNINNTNKRKDNDDLDLALDALRDCDTDFSKFVQVFSIITMLFNNCCFFRRWGARVGNKILTIIKIALV